MKKPLGYILHETSDLVVIATGFKATSTNRKTGGMIQIYILVKNMDPMDAVMSGADAIVCGDCKHRRTLRTNPETGKQEFVRPCYVNIGKGVKMVWSAYQRGRYAPISDWNVFSSRNVRFGAYGDTCHIPQSIYRSICAVAASWTGYTHQWKRAEFQWAAKYVMASCDNHAESEQAASTGWRRFRVTATNAARPHSAPRAHLAGPGPEVGL